MQKRLIILCLFCWCCHYTYGQAARTPIETSRYAQIGQESIFLHYNSSLLFAGEYLYYKVYCLDKKNNKTSNLSKIAYVELVGDSTTVVFKHKVRLDSGHGQGDFFIPISVPSGNYKLIGYTQWMMNWGEGTFFQDDIKIINPYTNRQKISSSSEGSDSVVNRIDGTTAKNRKNRKSSPHNATNKLAITLSEDNYSKREKVEVEVNSLNGQLSFGRYSISVRKQDSLETSESLSSVGFTENLKQNINMGTATRARNAFPEIRGDLFSGYIIANNGSLPINNQKVLLSIPQPNYKIKVLTTDIKGRFNYSVSDKRTSEKAILQVLGYGRENYTITLNTDLSPDYNFFTFKKFELNPKMEKAILKRSIHNQVENAYFGVKPDTIVTSKKAIPFYGADAMVYHLDEYTRFSTFEETILEIISNVWVTKDENGRLRLEMGAKNASSFDFGYQPLVIVDGNVVQDFDKLVEFNARNIKTITVTKDLYMVGGHIFQGVLDIETFKNDYPAFNGRYMYEFNTLIPREDKKYFKQTYGPKNAGRAQKIPDYRYQLLWLPTVDLNRKAKTIEFYTSDVPGRYMISLEGFTFSGSPVSIKKIFTVD